MWGKFENNLQNETQSRTTNTNSSAGDVTDVGQNNKNTTYNVSWRFKFSGLLRRVIRYMVNDVSIDGSAFIFKVKQSQTAKEIRFSGRSVKITCFPLDIAMRLPDQQLTCTCLGFRQWYWYGWRPSIYIWLILTRQGGNLNFSIRFITKGIIWMENNKIMK
jgi:hypothetical protein